MSQVQPVNPAAEAAVDHKSDVRERVFRELRNVALADSRFHFDFGEFIADFEGSQAALDRLTAHPFYQQAQCIFITPDNCVEMLRWQALRDGKLVLMTTYSILRGFWLLDPATIPADRMLHAATLDGMERYGTPRVAIVSYHRYQDLVDAERELMRLRLQQAAAATAARASDLSDEEIDRLIAEARAEAQETTDG